MGEVTIDGVVYEEFDETNFRKYVQCDYLPYLLAHREAFGVDHIMYKDATLKCRSKCQFKGKDFLAWLVKNGYEPSKEMDETVLTNETPCELYILMAEEDVRILKKKEVEE
jgi:hypothetical protein